MAAIQAQLVGDQVKRHGEVARHCLWCGRSQSSKGHYQSTFRSVFGNIPMRVRRFHACPMPPRRAEDGAGVVHAPIAHRAGILYLTAKLAALMPFGKVADFLGEVLPLSTSHASTVRNRTLRVGKQLLRSPCRTRPSADDSGEPVVSASTARMCAIGTRGRPARWRSWWGRSVSAGDAPTRFAFVRRGSTAGAATITQALREHGVHPDTPVTVLSDEPAFTTLPLKYIRWHRVCSSGSVQQIRKGRRGDAGLRAIQRVAAPEAEPVLDCHVEPAARESS